MSNHVIEWLNAYHDGELHGNRLHAVEMHLAECELCRVELVSLQDLSSLLQEVHTPELMPVDQFAVQVNLRLPHVQGPAQPGKRIIEISWWMLPVGLIASWIFVGTAFALGDILSMAVNFGLLSGMSDWLASGPSNAVYVSTTIGQMGVLNGNGLNWAETTETFARLSLPQIGLQISIALLYLTWVAIWWARHTNQERGQLVEG